MTKDITIPSKFQSFIVIGKGVNLHKKSAEIAKQFKVDILKVSPDLSIISPEKKLISIDQIREIKKQIYQKPVAQDYKIIIIQEANKLTKQAQNSLLKIFEEPPRHAIIILEALDKTALLSTIVSRAIIVQAKVEKREKTESSLLDGKSVKDLLTDVSTVQNPTAWLDDQITALYEKLKTDVKKQSREDSTEQIQKTIEKCIEAKKMIDANVNAKFVLANLIFSIYPEV